MRTIESLGIYWNFESEGKVFQDEVDGIIFYGFWKDCFSEEILKEISQLEDIWKDIEFEVRPNLWSGSSNCNLSIEFWIKKFPEFGWENKIYLSLKWFIEKGALLSWCGNEFSSPSLESFREDSSAGEVYAAYSKKTGFLCKSGLYDDYNILDDDELVKISDIIF